MPSPYEFNSDPIMNSLYAANLIPAEDSEEGGAQKQQQPQRQPQQQQEEESQPRQRQVYGNNTAVVIDMPDFDEDYLNAHASQEQHNDILNEYMMQIDPVMIDNAESLETGVESSQGEQSEQSGPDKSRPEQLRPEQHGLVHAKVAQAEVEQPDVEQSTPARPEVERLAEPEQPVEPEQPKPEQPKPTQPEQHQSFHHFPQQHVETPQSLTNEVNDSPNSSHSQDTRLSYSNTNGIIQVHYQQLPPVPYYPPETIPLEMLGLDLVPGTAPTGPITPMPESMLSTGLSGYTGPFVGIRNDNMLDYPYNTPPAPTTYTPHTPSRDPETIKAVVASAVAAAAAEAKNVPYCPASVQRQRELERQRQLQMQQQCQQQQLQQMQQSGMSAPFDPSQPFVLPSSGPAMYQHTEVTPPLDGSPMGPVYPPGTVPADYDPNGIVDPQFQAPVPPPVYDPRPYRKQSESRLSLPNLYERMGLSHNHQLAREREQRVLGILQREGFNLGERTWIRDTSDAERKRIMDTIWRETYPEFGYGHDLLEVIVRRGSYYLMQGRLRRIRRGKRATERARSELEESEQQQEQQEQEQEQQEQEQQEE